MDDVQTPQASVMEHDQATAPGKERERDPVPGGDLINISNGVVNSEQRESSRAYFFACNSLILSFVRMCLTACLSL